MEGKLRLLMRRELARHLEKRTMVMLVLGEIVTLASLTVTFLKLLPDHFLLFLFSFPSIWIGVLLIGNSSIAISSERQNQFLDLIRMSPVRGRDYLSSKLLMSVVLYLIFALIFLFHVLFLSLSFGYFLLLISMILVFGPYLALYLFLNSLVLLVSSSFDRERTPTVFAAVIFLFLIVSNLFFNPSSGGQEDFNPLAMITQDILRISVGIYPEPMIWSAVISSTVILSLLNYLVILRIWKEVDE